jgi:hypothetical protein
MPKVAVGISFFYVWLHERCFLLSSELLVRLDLGLRDESINLQ